MRKMKHRLCILFTLLLFFAHSTTICGAQYDDDTDATLAPYFLIDGMDTATDSFPLKETNVSVNINGIFAETFVTQTYSNEGQEPINATNVFPLPTSPCKRRFICLPAPKSRRISFNTRF